MSPAHLHHRGAAKSRRRVGVIHPRIHKKIACNPRRDFGPCGGLFSLKTAIKKHHTTVWCFLCFLSKNDVLDQTRGEKSRFYAHFKGVRFLKSPTFQKRCGKLGGPFSRGKSTKLPRHAGLVGLSFFLVLGVLLVIRIFPGFFIILGFFIFQRII